MLDVLALGAGVQTTALLLMAIKGQHPRPDAVIFADPGWEPPAVYRNLAWLKRQCNAVMLPLLIISTGNIRRDAIRCWLRNEKSNPDRWASMPLFTLDPEGHKGMLRRQCTGQYKIRPIDSFIRRVLLKIKKHHKAPPDSCNLWLGISTDEQKRARSSGCTWKTNRFPLLEQQISRQHCHAWLDKNNIHHPAKSSCIGCPYRNNVEWLWLKTNQPAAWKEAVRFDHAIRDSPRLGAQLFLHQRRIPLDDVDLSASANEIDNHPWATECLGYCGT